MTFVCELVGIGGWPLISTWINPCPLGSNGLHFIEFPHQLGNVLLNLAPGEPLSLVQELPFFDNKIKIKILLSCSLDLCVHDMINRCMFHAVIVELYRCQLFFYL
jgi:hypothetical protein